MTSLADQLANEGFAVVPDVVSGAETEILAASLSTALAPGDTRGGVRHLLRDYPVVRQLAESTALRAIAEAAVGAGARPVRGILFDKSASANWKVIWHQDLTIGVRERRDVPGFGPWSEKDGRPHVQPPVELLQDMVAVRLHLDDCDEDNGPVRVLPASHRAGRLTAGVIAQSRSHGREVTCTVPSGGVLAFRSLLLHASAPARVARRRRVVHIEYVAARWATLPHGLVWEEVA